MLPHPSKPCKQSAVPRLENTSIFEQLNPAPQTTETSQASWESKANLTYILVSRLLLDFSSIQQTSVAMKEYVTRRGIKMKVIYKHSSRWNSTTVWWLSTQASVKIELRYIFRTHFDEKPLINLTFNHLAPVRVSPIRVSLAAPNSLSQAKHTI